jgi:hypothetical protein
LATSIQPKDELERTLACFLPLPIAVEGYILNSKAQMVLGGLLVAGFAIVGYSFVISDSVQATLQTGVESVIRIVDNSPARPEPESETDVADEAEPATPATSGPPPEPTEEPAVSAPATPELVSEGEPEPVVALATNGVSEHDATTVAPVLEPEAHYLAGNQSTWSALDITTTVPLAIRAAGLVSAGADIAGPAGLKDSAYEHALRFSKAGQHARVLQSAPYLALLGRVCSDRLCSEPFLIGSDTVLCPADLGVTGHLQFLTNNYVRIDGQQTLRAYSSVGGGYSFLTESAATGACGDPPDGAEPEDGTGRLAPGLVLKRADFRISSSQTYWKPFFVPLDAPVMIRASGTITSGPTVPDTGPEGAPLPESLARNGLGMHGLYEPALPYHALIGRLCNEQSCGRPFLVGRQQTICPSDRYDHHIDLWVNRIMTPPGLLDDQTPLTLKMFELQARDGEYAFEVTGAPAGSCSSR